MVVAYAVIESMTVYDMRLIQARTGRFASAVAERGQGRVLPAWVGHVHLAGWLVLIGLFVLNWRYAIACFLLLYVLRVVPVLERIGEAMLRPFLLADGPIMDLVELTGTLAARPPNTSCSARVSSRSFISVPVPWAFT